jgi:hypothetical protein
MQFPVYMLLHQCSSPRRSKRSNTRSEEGVRKGP